MDDLKVFPSDGAQRIQGNKHRVPSDADGAQFQSEFDGLERGHSRANGPDPVPSKEARSQSHGKDDRRFGRERDDVAKANETGTDDVETDGHDGAPGVPVETADTTLPRVVPDTDGKFASSVGAAQTVPLMPNPAADDTVLPDTDGPSALTRFDEDSETTAPGTLLPSITSETTAGSAATPDPTTAHDEPGQADLAPTRTGTAQASAEDTTTDTRAASPQRTPEPEAPRADTSTALLGTATSQPRAAPIEGTAAPGSGATDTETPGASPTALRAPDNRSATTDDTLSVSVSRSDPGSVPGAKTGLDAKGGADTTATATDRTSAPQTSQDLPKSAPLPAAVTQSGPPATNPRIVVSQSAPAATILATAAQPDSGKPDDAGRQTRDAWAFDPPAPERIAGAPAHGWTANAHAAQAARLTDRMSAAAWTVALAQSNAERETQIGLFATDELAFSTTGALQSASVSGATAPATAMPSIAQQIAAALVDPRNDRSGPIDVALDPPELGRVRLSVTEVNGAIMLSITADRPETADLMRRHVALLMEEFARSGLDAPSVDISGGDRGTRDRETSTGDGANRGGPVSPDGHASLDAPAQRPTPRIGQGDLDLRL